MNISFELEQNKNFKTLKVINEFYPHKIKIECLSELKLALKSILFALDSLHKAKFVHHDLCCSNILYSHEPIISKF